MKIKGLEGGFWLVVLVVLCRSADQQAARRIETILSIVAVQLVVEPMNVPPRPPSIYATLAPLNHSICILTSFLLTPAGIGNELRSITSSKFRLIQMHVQRINVPLSPSAQFNQMFQLNSQQQARFSNIYSYAYAW